MGAPGEYRARYFGAAAHEMRGHEFYRVALARVPAHAALGAVCPKLS